MPKEPENSDTDLTFGFGAALERLKEGHAVRRRDWPSWHWLTFHTERVTDERTLDLLLFHTGPNLQASPWGAHDGDLLAEDWMIVEGE